MQHIKEVKNRIHPPKWLSKDAQSIWRDILRTLPANLDTAQLHLVAAMACCIDTYRTAEEELNKWAGQYGTLTVTGTNGAIVPHPAFKIQQQKSAEFISSFRQLRLSLEGEDLEKVQAVDAVSQLLSKSKGLI